MQWSHETHFLFSYPSVHVNVLIWADFPGYLVFLTAMDLKPEIRRPLFQRTACLTTRKTSLAIITLAALWVLGWHIYEAEFYFSLAIQSPQANSVKLGCPFPLPNHLFKEKPLCPSEGPLRKSSKKLDAFLSERASHPDIDSLSIAVVTPYGTIFERGYGVLKANETVSQKPVSRNSIYRIASITKMFTVLETLILRERGVLNLWVLLVPTFEGCIYDPDTGSSDDPVEMFLPELEIPGYGWSDYLKDEKNSSSGTRPRITLRQLASHMSGKYEFCCSLLTHANHIYVSTRHRKRLSSFWHRRMASNSINVNSQTHAKSRKSPTPRARSTHLCRTGQIHKRIPTYKSTIRLSHLFKFWHGPSWTFKCRRKQTESGIQFRKWASIAWRVG